MQIKVYQLLLSVSVYAFNFSSVLHTSGIPRGHLYFTNNLILKTSSHYSCNLYFPEPQEDDLTEKDLQNLYSQPHKRKKEDLSPENVTKPLVGSSDKDHKSESPGEDYSDKDPTVVCPKKAEKDDNDQNFATPPSVARVINPFSKQLTSLKKYPVSNLRVSSMKKTVIDSNTVVQSR